MKIKVNKVEIQLPVEGGKLYVEDMKGVESAEMDVDEAIEVLLASVRKPAEKMGAAVPIAYGRIWKLLDPTGTLAEHIGPGWVREICTRMVKAGVLR